MASVQRFHILSGLFILVDVNPLIRDPEVVQQESAATGSTTPGGTIQNDFIRFLQF
jgi:hypothetical protein